MSTIPSDVLSQFLEYDFDHDEQYQSILNTWEAPKIEVEIQSKVSYFNLKYGTTVNWEEALTRLRGTEQPIKSVPQVEDTQQLSLADLQVILQGGDTSQIPNNKPIPNDLNTVAPSSSSAPIRKKPWERESMGTQ